ncbi:MAG TPA: hypothetical protein VGI06_09000, partial [Acidimicrobiales bacterium]
MTKLPVRTHRGCRLMAVLSLAGAAALLVPLAAPGPAGAVAPAADGYWVKLGAPVPTVPKGGLRVAADPTSATSSASPVGS